MRKIPTLFNKSALQLALLFFCFSFLFTSQASAATYYVDATTGNDTNIGTSIGKAWKTIEKVNTSTFSPNDSILFKKGEIWHEKLIIPSSGAVKKPITFGAYTNSKSTSPPTIDGTKTITDWKKYTGNIYVADVDFSVARVFTDNSPVNIAHYPNSGYEKITANSENKKSLASISFDPPSNDLVGAGISIHSVSWSIEDKTITDYSDSGHQISWQGNTKYDIEKDFGFYVTNKLWMLDQPDEWFYDSSEKKLYLWLEKNDNPSTHAIEATTNTSVGISVTDKNNIVIKDLDVRNTGADGIQLNSVTNALLQNLHISFAGQYGIYSYGKTSNNITISNNTLDKNLLGGIKIGNVLGATTLITNNTISNTGNFGLPVNSFAGIMLERSSNVIVLNNTVSNSSYIGIRFSGNNNLIQTNFITKSCLILDDCGGIYTGGNFGTGNKIVKNVITDSIGNWTGTPKTTSQAEGIYLDDNSNHTTVSDNTIDNTRFGIVVHNSYANIITNNTAHKSRRSGLFINEDTIVNIPGIIKDNFITNNIFLNNSPEYSSVFFRGTLGSTNFGKYDSNYYSSVYYYPISQQVSTITTNYSLPDWQTTAKQDVNSKDIGSFYKVAPQKVEKFIGNNLVSNSLFDANISLWKNWSDNKSVVMNWVSACRLDNGCLEVFTNSEKSPYIASNNFSLQAGKTYQATFSLISDGIFNGTAIVRKSTTPWTSFGRYKFSTSTARQDISFTFTAPDSIINDVSFAFSTNDPNTHYFIDNVSVQEVSLFNNSSADDSLLYFNTDKTKQKINLGNKQYCDVNNNIITNAFVLDPFKSKVLLSCFNNNDHVCNNRETHATAPTDCP